MNLFIDKSIKKILFLFLKKYINDYFYQYELSQLYHFLILFYKLFN